MPLSTDAQVLETSNGLVSTLRGMAGGAAQSFRPGTLTPDMTLSRLEIYDHYTYQAHDISF